MYKIAFVIPYFVNGGGMPNYFQLWLKTAGWNADIDFFLFTDADIQRYDVPENIHIKCMAWDEVIELFQSKFDFKLALDSPYKLCDFKPAYGEVFEEYLQGYDFWGHCDIDLFFGKIRRFVRDDLLNRYDRIYTRGHCCLYRNTSTVNSWYRTLPCMGYQKWNEVFMSGRSCCFDEWAGHCGGGLSMIIKANKIPVYDRCDFADLNVSKGWFCPNGKAYNNKHIYFSLNSEGCFVHSGKEQLDEVVYVHFQKRKLKISVDDNTKEFFLCAPANVLGKPQADVIGQKKYEIMALYKRMIHKLEAI